MRVTNRLNCVHALLTLCERSGCTVFSLFITFIAICTKSIETIQPHTPGSTGTFAKLFEKLKI